MLFFNVISFVSPLCFSQAARVWIPDAEEVWKSAELIKDYKNGDASLQLMLEDGTVRIIRVEREKNLSPSIFVAFCFSL